MLESTESDAGILLDWERRVRLAQQELRWPAAPVTAVAHASGASLAFGAPPDQLFTATEVNEWALCSALAERDPSRSAELIAALAAEQPEETEPPTLVEWGAMLRLRRRAAREANPHLRALLDAATERALPWLCDDDLLTLGAGAGGRGWLLHQLPEVGAIPWNELHGIPTALVTGTNGKTTVVRLIAACTAASGRKTGFSCTDGVFVGGHAIGTGDYSGPAGARRVLRDTRVEAAVLETARGGILRRGLAVGSADVAVITSIAADHFGEYGIHDLDALTETKLAVARALGANGLLIVNADDAQLARKAPEADKTLGWFARDANHWLLTAQRLSGGTVCSVMNGRLLLAHDHRAHDLGAIDSMPLAAGGQLAFNISNLAAAAIAAIALGVEPATIAEVFARFGSDPCDNTGRLMRYELGGLNLIVDFAHNPAALSGLVDFAQRLRGPGRLAMLLGQAGNREDADLGRLAAVAAAARPDLVVLKEMSGYLRGRDAGEIPAILRRALVHAGVADAAIVDVDGEDAAVRHALAWARAGDILMLAVHTPDGRTGALSLIDRLRRQAWTAGQPLPA